MRIQDVGIWIGIFFICMAMAFGLAINMGTSIGLDWPNFDLIPYVESLPYVFGGLGGVLAVVSLVSLARSK